MNHLALHSSITSTNSSFFSVAYASDTQSCRPAMEQSTTPFEFQPVTQTLAYVMGRQLAKIAHFVYSRLPSFSLPLAQASSTSACDVSAVCATPTGSYEKSCHRPAVTYLPEEDQCLVTTRCETMYEGLAHKLTSLKFPPRGAAPVLENNNGTLVVLSPRGNGIQAQLDESFKILPAKEALQKERDVFIEVLRAGDVITLNGDLELAMIPSKKWSKDGTSQAFQRIAQATGGIMGLAPSSTRLNPLIETIFAHVLKAAQSSEQIDIAFVLDTTLSMEPYIAQVQNHLVQFLTQLQEQKEGNAHILRIALLEYRDKDDEFLNRVNTGFTSDLHQVEGAVRRLRTAGGGDEPEAVLDALLSAKNDLSWDPKAKRIVILIGDAPPQPKTKDGLHSEAAIIAQYQAADTQIAVYPILGT